MFRNFTALDLTAWWQQYGSPTQACGYPGAGRRAARAEFGRRGMAIPAHQAPTGLLLLLCHEARAQRMPAGAARLAAARAA